MINYVCSFSVIYAGMAELADAQDLGSCEAIRVGSTPTTRTINKTGRQGGGLSYFYKIFLADVRKHTTL